MKLREKLAVSYIRTNLRILSVLSKERAAQKAMRLFCTPFIKYQRRTTPLFDKAERLQFFINQKRITGYRWNPHQQKKFLIIHGFQSSAIRFEKYIAPMVSKGYEVLAFDAQAHGESEGTQINVLEYKNLIVEICSRYGPFDAFLAHSFGGLAVSLALEEISHSDSTRLVLIAPATETSSAVDLLFSFLKLSNNLRDVFDKLIITTGGKTAQWLSISRAIENIRARVLWIHDEDDDITPLKDVKPLIKAGYSNVEFLITKGLGHRQIYHDKKVIETVSSFL